MIRGLAVYAVWTSAALLCALASVQAADARVRLVLSTTPLKEEPKRDRERRAEIWLLRPNIQQELLTYVKNDDPSQAATVTVQLLAGGAEIVAQKITVEAGKLAQATWARPGAAANSPPVFSELIAPVELRLLDSTGKPLGESVKVEINRPSNYLQAGLEFIPESGGDKNRLIATVTPKPDSSFQGPPCRVDLVLDPDRIPALVSRKTQVWSGNVTPPRRNEGGKDGSTEPLYIVAEDVRLRPDKRQGLVTLRADGYNRAFLFDTTFVRAGTPPTAQETSTRILRIDAPPYADPRNPVHVTLEADRVNEPDNKRLVLDAVTLVDKGDKKGATERFSQLAEFRGDRGKRLFYTIGGPRYGLLLKPEVKDWNADLDLGGLHGKVTLRLRLLDENNKPLEVLDTDKEKWKPEGDVRKTIVLDDTPPEGVRVRLPAAAVRGKPFVVQASGMDEESGIRDVVFFLGKLTPDGKLPPQTIPVPGERLEESRVWAGKLVVPLDQKGPLDVSVRFTNNVGLSTTEVVTLLEVTDVPVAVKVAKKGSIAGVVREGDRPQAGLDVQLLNAGGKVLVTTKTGTDGTFVFKDLDPGDYQVSSTKTADDTKGITPVTFGAGEDKKGVAITLWR